MAMKDWKKTKSKTYNPLFIHKKTYGNHRKEIGIAEIGDYVWEVDFFNIPGLKIKEFETKKEALDFAKDVMRKH